MAAQINIKFLDSAKTIAHGMTNSPTTLASWAEVPLFHIMVVTKPCYRFSFHSLP